MGAEPPIFEERRQLPDRRRSRPPSYRTPTLLRTAVAASLAVAGGLVIVYVFFATVAEVDVAEAVVATAVIGVLAVVWLVAYGLRGRAARERGRASSDRERRGF